MPNFTQLPPKKCVQLYSPKSPQTSAGPWKEAYISFGPSPMLR